jgi:hypothetical protein
VLPRRRDVESRSMNQASALMCRNQKHKRQPEINRRHHEEIYRGKHARIGREASVAEPYIWRPLFATPRCRA